MDLFGNVFHLTKLAPDPICNFNAGGGLPVALGEVPPKSRSRWCRPEFAGPASPAFDLAHWQVSAGDGLHGRSDLLRLGYARAADPDAADAGWVPAFAIDFALKVLGWKNPAPPARLRRCVDVIAWPWMRAALSAVAFLLAVKVAVARRAGVAHVSRFEEVLRRLAFVDFYRADQH